MAVSLEWVENVEVRAAHLLICDFELGSARSRFEFARSGCDGPRYRVADLCDVPVIGATATADHIQIGQHLFELGILRSQFVRVAVVQRFAFVQLGM